jgi:dihydroflavonol-4-reductase
MRKVKFALVPEGGVNIVHVDDAAMGIIKALISGRSGERYILGGENLSFALLHKAFMRQQNRLQIVLIIPNAVTRPLLQGISILRGALPPDLFSRIIPLTTADAYKFYSSAKAARELGYNPQHSARQIMAEALGPDYFRASK